MKVPNFLKSVFLGIPIGITLLDSVGYVARVDGISMQPALNPDKDTADYVFLNRWSVRAHEVARGDIISLKSPKDPEQKIIKRIVGLQGDIIATLGYKNDILRVPEGHCWIEGDHTGHTLDSNNFGPVSIGLVTAKATHIVWPPSRWQYIKPYLPEARTPLNLATTAFDFNGSVLRKGLTLGDVDNDGNYELIVANETGEVAIFKALDRWQTISNLGFVSCVIVGDILNQNKNCLVVVTADGWCFIFAADESDLVQEAEPADKLCEQVDNINVATESQCSSRSGSIAEETKESKVFLKKIHAQRIPPNTKDVLLGDIDGDGQIEMVLGLTDRVVRSYRWVDIPRQNNTNYDFEIIGKLVALNKWECAQQIGSISLHHSIGDAPSLLVAQPGGTFMRIRHEPEEIEQAQQAENLNKSDVSSSTENLAGFSVDYQFLGISRMRNPNISTEILGDLRTEASLKISTVSGIAEPGPAEGRGSESQIDDTKGRGSPYAVATLDGTIMLVQDEIILWAIAVDRQLFALTKLDVTCNGIDEIVVCSWDGHTYILDQQKNTVRFQLDESVRAFEVGYYTLIPGNAPVTCFVYITFRNKILLYFDIPLKHMVTKKFDPDFTKFAGILKGETEEEKKERAKNLSTEEKRELIRYLLYGVKSK